MENIQLTPHFKLSEFVKSSTALENGIDNTPSATAIQNLKRLCEEILEPFRNHVGKAIVIGSGFRCQALNKMVGGSPKSNHLTGCAADIHLPRLPSGATDVKTGRAWFVYLMDNFQYDELIWETADRKHFWIHVALCPNDNRQKVTSFLLKPTAKVR